MNNMLDYKEETLFQFKLPVCKLTHKQQKFVERYLISGNASQSYREVYDASKMKPQTIWRKAYDVLHNGKVTAMINAIRGELEQRTQATLHITRESQIQKCEEALWMAYYEGKLNAFVSLIRLQSQLAGLLNGQPRVIYKTLADLTIEELRQEVRESEALLAELSA